MNQLLKLLMQYAQRAGNTFAPRRVGVHHTVAGTHLGGVNPNVLPYWQAPYIRPSSAQYGRQGVTSSDQIPGMSYFWDATGNNARRAATEGVNQPNMVIANNIFGNDTVSRALTVTAPRFGVLNDANPGVQGGVARMVPGENQLRVVGEVAGTQGVNARIPGTRVDVPGGLPASAIDDITAMVNRQKAIEASKSAAKIGAAGTVADLATPTPGFFRSAGSAFLSDPVANVNRIAEQREAGQNRGAIGTYLGTLAQGSIGMALGAGLAPQSAPQPTRGMQANTARLNAMSAAHSPRPKSIDMAALRQMLR